MQHLPNKNDSSHGQTLIGLLIAIAIFAILGQAIFTLISASYSLVSFTRARITARHLAQEKIEVIRNLSYDDVGTVGGIPSGPLPQSENVVRNGLNYVVSTSVVYIDDAFDNSAPTDLLPTDYKRVRVDISWEGLASSSRNPITIISDVAPRGIESTAGGGTLSILVFDANAQPVPQADVSIIATSTTPQVNLNLQTGDDGRIILPGSPICTSCYQITVTKPDYSIDRTYSTVEVTNPDKPYLSVLQGFLTEVSFAIDKESKLKVNTYSSRDDGFDDLGNITFTLRGDKTIGTDSNDELVYKFENLYTTDAGGEVEIENLEWDNYQITVDSADGWDISGLNPLLPITLLPDTTVNSTFALENHTTHNLLTSFVDNVRTPIASVAARLYDDSGFEASASSGISDDPDFGQSFFSNLSSQIYHLQATMSGYLDFNGDVSVGGNTFEEIILTAN